MPLPFDSKLEQNLKRGLKTQRLVIPILIGANASPSAKDLSSDEEGFLYLKTEGADQITLARDAVDNAAELAAIPFGAPSDADGKFSALIKIGEPILKVCSVTLCNRAANEMVVGHAPGTVTQADAEPPADAPDMASLESFAILAGSTVTNTGSSVINGDLGLSPGTSVVGFPPGTVNGTQHVANAAAAQAQIDLTAAYVDLQSRTPTQDLTGQNLGGMTLTPGVYSFSTSAQLTGTLTLNAQNNPEAVFIFKIGSTLTTASASSVVMINGSNNNVYWQVGTSATFGTTTQFMGDVLAQASITFNTGAQNPFGRALARVGAVTLDSNLNISAVDNDATVTPFEGSYITIEGDKIVADFNTAGDFSSADGDYALEIEYVV